VLTLMLSFVGLVTYFRWLYLCSINCGGMLVHWSSSGVFKAVNKSAGIVFVRHDYIGCRGTLIFTLLALLHAVFSVVVTVNYEI